MGNSRYPVEPVDMSTRWPRYHSYQKQKEEFKMYREDNIVTSDKTNPIFE